MKTEIISDKYCWKCGLYISDTTHYGVGGIIEPRCMSNRTLSFITKPRYRDCFKIDIEFRKIQSLDMEIKRKGLLV